MTFRFLQTRKSVFQYPFGETPRTAVLVQWFKEPRLTLRHRASVRAFADWSEEVARFGPAVIAGTSNQLLALAAVAPQVTHSLICLSRPGDALLTAAQREQLWRAFRVPVFEQIIGPSGELLASECEAHDGLHAELAEQQWDGYAVDQGICACGLRTPRLSSPVPAERVRSVAMFAR